MSLSDSQKQAVRQRAGSCCEYCRISQSGSFARFHVDHIIALKHGGTNTSSNLCLACPKCNAYKGDNVAALDPQTDDPTKLFHPRRQLWEDHFSVRSDGHITGLTPEGRTTVAVLRFNNDERIRQRLIEMDSGDYPCLKQ